MIVSREGNLNCGSSTQDFHPSDRHSATDDNEEVREMAHLSTRNQRRKSHLLQWRTNISGEVQARNISVGEFGRS